MAITPATVKLFVWVFCSLYLAFKIPWTAAFHKNLPEAQAADPLVRTFIAGAHILVPALTLLTVTFPEISVIRTACILLAGALLFALLVKSALVSSRRDAVRASEFAVHLVDGMMLVLCFMVAVHFELLR